MFYFRLVVKHQKAPNDKEKLPTPTDSTVDERINDTNPKASYSAENEALVEDMVIEVDDNCSQPSTTNNIKIPCFKCNLVFPMNEFLNHQATHTNNIETTQNVTEVKCSECGMAFDTVENLINHMKVLHFSMWGTWSHYYNWNQMDQYGYPYMQQESVESFDQSAYNTSRRWASSHHRRKRSLSPHRLHRRHGHFSHHPRQRHARFRHQRSAELSRERCRRRSRSRTRERRPHFRTHSHVSRPAHQSSRSKSESPILLLDSDDADSSPTRSGSRSSGDDVSDNTCDDDIIPEPTKPLQDEILETLSEGQNLIVGAADSEILENKVIDEVSGDKATLTEVIEKETCEVTDSVSGNKKMVQEEIAGIVSHEQSAGAADSEFLENKVVDEVSGDKATLTEVIEKETCEVTDSVSGNKKMVQEEIAGIVSHEQSAEAADNEFLENKVIDEVCGDKATLMEVIEKETCEVTDSVSGNKKMVQEEIAGIVSHEQSAEAADNEFLENKVIDEVSGDKATLMEVIEKETCEVPDSVLGNKNMVQEEIADIVSHKQSAVSSIITSETVSLTDQPNPLKQTLTTAITESIEHKILEEVPCNKTIPEVGENEVIASVPDHKGEIVQTISDKKPTDAEVITTEANQVVKENLSSEVKITVDHEMVDKVSDDKITQQEKKSIISNEDIVTHAKVSTIEDVPLTNQLEPLKSEVKDSMSEIFDSEFLGFKIIDELLDSETTHEEDNESAMGGPVDSVETDKDIAKSEIVEKKSNVEVTKGNLAQSEVGDKELVNQESDNKGEIVEAISDMTSEFTNSSSPKKRNLKAVGRSLVYESNQLVCNICGFSGDDYYKYEQHILDAPNDHRFSCRCCDGKFLSIYNLRQHVRQKFNATTYSETERKYAKDNAGPTRYFCGFCGCQCPDYDSLVSHDQANHLGWFVTCPICKFKAAYSSQLFKHVQDFHVLVNNVDLLCQFCSLHFYCPFVYTWHMQRIHNQTNGVSYQCILCSENITSRDEFCLHVHKHRKYFMGHFQDVANERPAFNVKSHQCYICAKVVDKSLKQHMDILHPKKQLCYVPSYTKTKTQDKIMASDAKQQVSIEETVSLQTNSSGPIIKPENEIEAKDSKTDTSRTDGSSQIVCDICGFSCNDYYKYDKHMLDPPENHWLSCRCCEEKFSSAVDLWNHICSSHNATEYSKIEKKYAEDNPGSSKYFCVFCWYQSDELEALISHDKKNHAGWFLTCPLCRVRLAHPHQLLKHFQINHALPNNVSLRCQQCSYIFYDPHVFRCHMEKVHQALRGEITYHCILCSTIATSIEEFSLHVHSHGRYSVAKKPNWTIIPIVNGRPMSNVKSRQCYICSKLLNVKLKTHLRSSHFKKCPICQEAVLDLARHYSMFHESEECPCEDNKNDEKQLVSEYFTCESRQLVCGICGFSCDDYYKYEKHILNAPENHYISCRCCEEKCTSFLNLKKHIKRCHDSSTYSNEERKFAKDKPSQYFCEFCGLKFAEFQAFVDHNENNHAGWCVSCPLCVKKLGSATQLFVHFMRAHALVNNIDLKCQECSYHFYCPFIYQKHMRQVHQEFEFAYRCILCREVITDIHAFVLHVHKHNKYYVGEPGTKTVTMANGRPTCIVDTKQCYICSKIENVSLKRHLITSHSNVSTIKCKICHNVVPNTEFAVHYLDSHVSGDKKQSNTVNKQSPVGKSAPQNKKQSSENHKQVECDFCFALIDELIAPNHLQFHRDKGTRRSFRANILLNKAKFKNSEFVSCRICNLLVRRSLIYRHKSIHTIEKTHFQQPNNDNNSGNKELSKSGGPIDAAPTNRQNFDMSIYSQQNLGIFQPQTMDQPMYSQQQQAQYVAFYGNQLQQMQTSMEGYLNQGTQFGQYNQQFLSSWAGAPIAPPVDIIQPPLPPRDDTICSGCKREFDTSKVLSVHELFCIKLADRLSRQNVHSCPVCLQRFPSLLTIKQHMFQMHAQIFKECNNLITGKVAKNECKSCKQTFNNKEELAAHEMTHAFLASVKSDRGNVGASTSTATSTSTSTTTLRKSRFDQKTRPTLILEGFKSKPSTITSQEATKTEPPKVEEKVEETGKNPQDTLLEEILKTNKKKKLKINLLFYQKQKLEEEKKARGLELLKAEQELKKIQKALLDSQKISDTIDLTEVESKQHEKESLGRSRSPRSRKIEKRSDSPRKSSEHKRKRTLSPDNRRSTKKLSEWNSSDDSLATTSFEKYTNRRSKSPISERRQARPEMGPYDCNKCGILFTNFRDFISHCSMHGIDDDDDDDDEYGELPATQSRFVTKSKRSNKRKLTESEEETGPYDCNKCGTLFTNYRDFIIHNVMHESDYDPPEGSSRRPKRTRKSSKSGDKIFNCDKCDTPFTDLKEFFIHKSMHKNVNDNNDDDKVLLTKKAKRQRPSKRERQKFKADQKMGFYKCNRCPASCTNFEDFVVHVATHEDYDGDEELAATIVKKSKKSKCERKRAKKLLKSKEEMGVYNCNKCVTLFTNYSDFISHSATHQNDNDDDIFPPLGTAYAEIDEHPVYAPPRMVTITCQICTQEFRSQEDLDYHACPGPF